MPFEICRIDFQVAIVALTVGRKECGGWCPIQMAAKRCEGVWARLVVSIKVQGCSEDMSHHFLVWSNIIAL